jgi:ubiquinone/menaquinone biosynthesis C-methylase UbiE
MSAGTDRDADAYDAFVVPRYASRFARMVLDAFDPTGLDTVLDVGCATGRLTVELLSRLSPHARVIAIERDHAKLELARRRTMDEDGKRVFYKAVTAEETRFGDAVFDAVIANLVLNEVDDEEIVLDELHRVLAPGGRILVSRPLAGTFGEVLDMFREQSVARDDDELAERIATVERRYPSADDLSERLSARGFADVRVLEETFALPFDRASEIFTDPVPAMVGLPEWRWIAGFDEDGPDRLIEVETALATYFDGRVSLTVNAGLAIASAGSADTKDEFRPPPASREG